MRIFVSGILILFTTTIFTQQNVENIYLLSGQGSDERIFKNLQLDTTCNLIYVSYFMPSENETMSEFALRMCEKIDTTKPFAIIGVSLGGMLAVEMTNYISPEKVIILSGASSSEEIPAQYKFFRNLPAHKEIPAWLFKYSTFVLQPMYEPDRKSEKTTCMAMIKNKDALFIKRATHLIVTWQRSEKDNMNKNVVQIHGDIDHTLPVKNISSDYIIKDGSHMMTLIKAEEISKIINSELKN
ncbi:MAG: alpha/beta hydrolase [Fimbriimonadaceae bacterium]|nr:alpha/beta hydrolase [Chitinophagales bacterium]